jgi:hypothetical protein
MHKTRVLVLAAATAGAAVLALPLHAAPPSPPVFWAGCAGALAVKAERSGSASVNAQLAPMMRRALAQAKIAANPERLTPAQINGVALSATRSFRTQLARNPGQTAAFDRAVKLCMDSVAKLPK